MYDVKDIYIDELKYYLDKNNKYNPDQLVGEKYFEYELKKFSSTPNKTFTQEFVVADNKWYIFKKFLI